MSTLKVNKIEGLDISSKVEMPSGSVVQVVEFTEATESVAAKTLTVS